MDRKALSNKLAKYSGVLVFWGGRGTPAKLPCDLVAEKTEMSKPSKLVLWILC